MFVFAYIVNIIHEFGHYISLKLFSVPVKSMCFTLDARKKIKIKNTEFIFGFIPYAGYVETMPHQLSRIKEIVVASSGVLLTCVFAYLISVGAYLAIGDTGSTTKVTASNSTLLLTNDVVISVNSNRVFNDRLAMLSYVDSKNVNIEVLRDGKNINIQIDNFANLYYNRSLNFEENGKRDVVFVEALFLPIYKVDLYFHTYINLYKSFVFEKTRYEKSNTAFSFDLVSVISLFSIFSILHALFALVHITPFGDGGRILFNVFFPKFYSSSRFLEKSKTIELYYMLISPLVLFVFLLPFVL